MKVELYEEYFLVGVECVSGIQRIAEIFTSGLDTLRARAYPTVSTGSNQDLLRSLLQCSVRVFI